MTFIEYVAFLAAGMAIGAICGLQVMRWYWDRGQRLVRKLLQE